MLTSETAAGLQGHRTASRWEVTTSEGSRPGWRQTAGLQSATAKGVKARQQTGAVRAQVLKYMGGQCYGDSNVCGDSEKPLLSSFELHSFGSIFSPRFILLTDYFAFSELISTGKKSNTRQLKNWSGIKHLPKIIH